MLVYQRVISGMIHRKATGHSCFWAATKAKVVKIGDPVQAKWVDRIWILTNTLVVDLSVASKNWISTDLQNLTDHKNQFFRCFFKLWVTMSLFLDVTMKLKSPIGNPRDFHTYPAPFSAGSLFGQGHFRGRQLLQLFVRRGAEPRTPRPEGHFQSSDPQNPMWAMNKIPWLIDCYRGFNPTWFTGDYDSP